MSKNTNIAEFINYVSIDGSGNVVATTGIKKSGGTSSQFLKADGSVDASTYATQTYVTTAVSNLVASAPSTLDTLNELATALGNDANFATTIATSIGTKQAQLNGTGFVKVTGTTVSYDNSTYLTSASLTGYIPYTGATGNVALGNYELGAKYVIAEGSAGLGGVISIKQDAAYVAKGNGYSSIASSFVAFDFYGYTGASTYKNFTLRFDGLTNNTRRQYTLPDSDGTLALTSNIPTNNNTLTNGAGYITSSSLSSYLPLTGGTLTGNLTLSNAASTTDLGGVLIVRGNGSTYSTHYLTTGAANVAAYYQYDAAGVAKNVIHAGSNSYITGGNFGIGLASPRSILEVQKNTGNTSIGVASNASLTLSQGGSVNDLSQIGFGYTQTTSPAVIGFICTSGASYTKGNLFFATRDVTTDTAPTTRLTITSAGLANFSSSVSAGTTFLSGIRSNTISPDNGTTNNYQGYGGYWALRTDESNRFNLDVYNSGSPISALQFSLAGSATFSNIIDGTIIRLSSTQPLIFTGGGNTATYTQTSIYSSQTNTSGDTLNGIFIERGRLADSASAEVRHFIIGARGGAIQWKCDGVGYTTQNSTAEVKPSGDADLFIGRYSGGAAKIFRVYQASADGYLELATGAGNVITKLSGYSGTLGYTIAPFVIGQTTATAAGAQLSVLGTSLAASFNTNQSGAGAGLCAYFVNNSGSGYASWIYIGSAPGTDWKIGKNISNSANTTYHFEIVDSSNNLRMQINNGTGNVTFSGTVTQNSDIRLKKNIRSIENPLSKILQTRGVLYDRVDESDTNEVGFIAQELELVLPELVSTSDLGIKSIKYQNIVAVLVEAIKELKVENNLLKDRLDKNNIN